MWHLPVPYFRTCMFQMFHAWKNRGMEVCMHENDISMHECEDFAPGMIFSPKKMALLFLAIHNFMHDFHPCKFWGKTFIFIHENYIFMHGNFIFMHERGNFHFTICSYMRLYWQINLSKYANSLKSLPFYINRLLSKVTPAHLKNENVF